MGTEATDDELARRSAIKLALRARSALARRERWLEQAVLAFDAAVPERIRGDERFAQALEDAETAEALEQAIASNRDEAQDWWMKAMRLLRAIQAADQAYERELGEALERHRKLITTGIEDNDDDATHGP
jgi:L-aminopeptidase/D-esterase-like protein